MGVHYGFSADIKMYLVIIGKQTASAIHSCPYCEGREPWIDNCILSSIGSLRAWNKKFVESGSVLKNAQHYKNVVNEPLLLGDEKTLILEMLNIPELHCLMGSVFKIITEMEKLGFSCKEEGEEFIEEFLKQQNISKCVYRGSNSFVGNQARKVLKCVDDLDQMAILYSEENYGDQSIYEKASPFIKTLRCLNEVVESCFGQVLDMDYEKYITGFSKQYRSLNIKVTPKVYYNEI